MPVTAVDDFKGYVPGLESPGRIVVVTPSDTDELAHVSRAFSFGVDGAIEAIDQDGIAVSIPAGALAVGIFHPGRFRKILSAGTTAQTILYQW